MFFNGGDTWFYICLDCDISDNDISNNTKNGNFYHVPEEHAYAYGREELAKKVACLVEEGFKAEDISIFEVTGLQAKLNGDKTIEIS